jgi:2-iminobutanoate/2-iminopropanoate deaminase
MKTTVHSPNAPAAVGPYSQAVKVTCASPQCGFVFSAGQLGLDPATGTFVAGNASDGLNADVVAQTRQAMRNLRAVLDAAGSSMAHIVKTTIFVVDLGAFKDINAAYGAFLESEGVTAPPARSTVQVAALPLGGLVEIEVIALLGASGGEHA